MFTKLLKILAVIAVLVFAGLQFVRPDFRNPPIKEGERIQDVFNVPADVAAVLKRSCADCHSNKTEFPWYSGIAPLSWGMADHINLGREELNFSIWVTYSQKRQKRKLEEMCEEVSEGNMPHYQYLWLHSEAVLTKAEKASLCEWTKSASEGIGENTGEQ